MAIKICNNTVIDNSRRFLGPGSNFFAGDSTGISGAYNIFIGSNAGQRTCSSTQYNIFLGRIAGLFNTTGSENLFIGSVSGLNNVGGSANTFLGVDSGVENINGNGSTLIGYAAGCRNNGQFNVHVGYYSGLGIYSGGGATPTIGTACQNVSVGALSGRHSYGCFNAFLGFSAGCCSGSNNNTYLGYLSGMCNSSGASNLYAGACSGVSGSSGNANVLLGFRSGEIQSGSCNVFVGTRSGLNVTTGTNNLIIGHNSGQTTATPTGLVNITTESNRIVMGNSSHTCAQIQVAWTAVSDVRDKCIFGPVPHGKGFLQNINPIEFAFKDRETGEVIDDQNKRRYGFCAQEVLESEGDNPVIVSTEDPNKLFMTNDYLIPVIVNAIKELDLENKNFKDLIDELTNSLQELKGRVDTLTTG